MTDAVVLQTHAANNEHNCHRAQVRYSWWARRWPQIVHCKLQLSSAPCRTAQSLPARPRSATCLRHQQLGAAPLSRCGAASPWQARRCWASAPSRRMSAGLCCVLCPALSRSRTCATLPEASGRPMQLAACRRRQPLARRFCCSHSASCTARLRTVRCAHTVVR